MTGNVYDLAFGAGGEATREMPGEGDVLSRAAYFERDDFGGRTGVISDGPIEATMRPLPDLAGAYAAVRAHSNELAAPLSAEDAGVQSMPDASPVKWHLAHTTWFFETIVLARGLGRQPFDSRFAYLFNSVLRGAGRANSAGQKGIDHPAVVR